MTRFILYLPTPCSQFLSKSAICRNSKFLYCLNWSIRKNIESLSDSLFRFLSTCTLCHEDGTFYNCVGDAYLLFETLKQTSNVKQYFEYQSQLPQSRKLRPFITSILTFIVELSSLLSGRGHQSHRHSLSPITWRPSAILNKSEALLIAIPIALPLPSPV